MQYQLLLVDAPYLAHRSFNLNKKLSTSSGLDSTLIHYFMRSLLPLKRKFPFAEMMFCWESYGSKQWRRELYQNYKRDRHVPDTYKIQMRDLQRLLSNLGYHNYYSPCNEADDVIATLCVNNSLSDIVIFTVDKDIMQMVNGTVQVFDGKKIYYEDDVIVRYGVYPQRIPDLLAIAGDVSDNIIGINGFGFKKSVDVIQKYDMIECLPEEHSLYCYIDTLLLNKRLTTLNRQAPLVDYKPLPFVSTNDIISKYELKQIGNDIDVYRNIRRSTL